MSLKVFTAFSGYDSQCMALDKLGIDYELVGWSEIDKYAIQAHNAVYPQWAERNYGDITHIDWENVPDFDLFTYSFPCQDISSAGKQRGLQKGSDTRSSLLWECQKAIEIKRPKYCLMENVAALVSVKFRPFFLEWERLMCRYGYTNYNKVLNAKDYGVPQNRERIFMVSINNAERSYYWPEPFKLEKRLKDVLEQNVDERYYLSERMITGFMRTSADTSNGHKFNPKDGEDVAFTIRTAPSQRVDDNFIKEKGGVSNTLTSVQKDNLVVEPKPYDENYPHVREFESKEEADAYIESLCIPQATKKGYIEEPPGSVFDASYPDSKTRRGRVQEGGQVSPTLMAGGEAPCYFEGVSMHPNSHALEFKGKKSIKADASPALRATDYKAPHCVWEKAANYRIRALTPKECFRLMGMSDYDIGKDSELRGVAEPTI